VEIFREWRTKTISIELVGWLASLSLALCAVPQAITCWRQGHAKGLDSWYLFLWFLGIFLMVMYVFGKYRLEDKPLLLNCCCNLLLIATIWKYKIFPREHRDAG